MSLALFKSFHSRHTKGPLEGVNIKEHQEMRAPNVAAEQSTIVISLQLIKSGRRSHKV